MDSNRPKVHIEKTTLTKFADILGNAGILVMILLVALNWGSLPDTVPTHFNGAGDADGWGSKFTLLILPVIAIFLHILLGVVERKPHLHNYPVRLTEENAPLFYAESVKIINLTKNIIALMFAYITYHIIRGALNGSDQLNIIGLAIFIILLFLVIIVGMVRMSKIK
ncbi:DUF1648 domain-containing protein [Lysinibacillus odysseyi]|uniref:DUF1648 domain-containing protein n=1 Tax=Lysinibacillus odysseyi 34hs-1 = NBRC 100172 TaxID=1220589 RepID=A0A0A3INE9_9BACI|nr:DUF1648 domain-containing protein [Lysinibacillus odysseyi]KGR85000.1 hypothetical protein CD32_11130 [Lysinibacillus odysseyi 34hs-1 = NBRC 100172]